MVQLCVLSAETDAWAWEQAGAMAWLHSSNWFMVLRGSGREVLSVEIGLAGERLGLAVLVVKRFGGRWRYCFCPKGPIFKKDIAVADERAAWRELLIFLTDRGYVFLRAEPRLAPAPPGWRSERVSDVDPEATLMLDITLPLNEIKAKFHPKTRYNIELAARRGVTVKEEKNPAGLLKLLRATGARDNFSLLPPSTYEQAIGSAASRQLVATVDGRPAAMGVFFIFGGALVYLYGASNYAERSQMAPYALQWAAVQLGQSLGLKIYDMFGIAPHLEAVARRTEIGASDYRYDLKHRYAGVTRFKLGFGGVVAQDPGTFEIPLQPRLYAWYRWFKRIL